MTSNNEVSLVTSSFQFGEPGRKYLRADKQRQHCLSGRTTNARCDLRRQEKPMKRTWTIIGVADVARTFNWYQSLFGQPASAPAHDYFGQILDTDGTVLLCLHKWETTSTQH